MRGSASAAARSVSNPARLASTAVAMNSNSTRSDSGERDSRCPLGFARETFSPNHTAACLYCRTGRPRARIWPCSADRSSRSSSSSSSSRGSYAVPRHRLSIRLTSSMPPVAEARVAAMVDATATRLGGLDILVNNAGTNIRRRPEEYRLEDWRTVIDTNLTSAMLASRAAHPHLKRGGRGRVINNGSMLSIFGLPFHVAYAASKGGVVQFTKSLATAWAADGITVNAILPGWIDTDLTRKARADMAGLNENVLARTPIKRWGDPRDFEGIAAFLASDAASFITGTAIPVDRSKERR